MMCGRLAFALDEKVLDYKLPFIIFNFFFCIVDFSPSTQNDRFYIFNVLYVVDACTPIEKITIYY